MRNKIRKFLKVLGGVFVIGTCVNCINVQAAPVEINETNFPDESFRKCVYDNDPTIDGVLSDEDIKNFRVLYVNDPVTKLDGKEYLYNLRHLYIGNYVGNEKIDFSTNKKLTEMSVDAKDKSKYIEINISNNTRLKRIFLKNTKIEKNSFSKNINLGRLVIENCELKDIDFTNNKKLRVLNIVNSNGNNISFPENFGLKDLYIENSNLKSIDFSNLKSMRELEISGGKFYDIDLSKSLRLKKLHLENCGLKNLDITKNKKLIKLYAPANNFKKINLRNNKNLEEIVIAGNPIKSLDLKNNKKLEELDVTKCKLKKLDLSRNVELAEVFCAGIGLKELNVSKLKKLKVLRCNNNKLKNIDVSNNHNLEELIAANNKISLIKFKNNKSLYDLDLSKNRLKKIDMSGCSNINYLRLSNNKLKKINIKKVNKKLYYLDIKNNKVSNIALKGAKRIREVDVSNNRIKNLDLSSCANVVRVNLKNNSNLKLKKGSYYAEGEKKKEYYRYKLKNDNTFELVTGLYGIDYSFNSDKDDEKEKNHKVKVIDIPDMVKIGGRKIEVTSIGKYAFIDSKKRTYEYVENITIGKNVKEIGEDTFENFGEIKKIIIKSGEIKNIEKALPSMEDGYKNIITIEVNKNCIDYYKKLFKNLLDLNYLIITEA